MKTGSTPSAPRVLMGWLAALVAGILVAPQTAIASDYLLAEGPATGSLQLDPTSYSEFGKRRRFGGRFGERFGGGGRFGGALTKRFPSLYEVFSGAEISLRPRAYYRYQKQPGGIKEEAFAAGGALEVQTGWWNDIVQFGATGYTSQEIYGPSGRGGSGLLTPGQKSITVLGELWMRAKWEDFTVQAGWNGIDIPYLNRNDSRMIPQTFQVAALFFEPREGFTIGVGHVSDIKPRDDDKFISMSKQAGADKDRGVTTAGLVWTNHECLDFAAFNHFGWDTFNTFYSELQWHGPGIALPGFALPVKLRAAFQFTDQRSVGDELLGDFETQNYGAKVAVGYKAMLVTFASSKTARNATIENPWGGSPSYVSSMISDFDRPGELAFRLIVNTDLGTVVQGLSGVASVGTGDSAGTDTERQKELDLTLDYRPPCIDGIWFRARGAWNDSDGAQTEDFRLIVNYRKKF